MNKEDLLTFLELDVDDRLIRANLGVALENDSMLRNVIEELKYLTPAQQLRVLDYLIYISWKTNGNPRQLYAELKLPRNESIIYSVTLISLYEWSNVAQFLEYFSRTKYYLISSVIEKIRNRLPEVSVMEKFLKEEIEEVGFDNAHLELLLLLEFIARLRDRGYKADLKSTYLGIIIDSNAPPEVHRKVKDSIVEDYKNLYNTDVNMFADLIYGMVLSLEEFESYARKVLGKPI